MSSVCKLCSHGQSAATHTMKWRPIFKSLPDTSKALLDLAYLEQLVPALSLPMSMACLLMLPPSFQNLGYSSMKHFMSTMELMADGMRVQDWYDWMYISRKIQGCQTY